MLVFRVFQVFVFAVVLPVAGCCLLFYFLGVVCVLFVECCVFVVCCWLFLVCCFKLGVVALCLFVVRCVSLVAC